MEQLPVKKPRANRKKKIIHTDTLAELDAKIKELTISLEITKSMRDIANARQENSKKASTFIAEQKKIKKATKPEV